MHSELNLMLFNMDYTKPTRRKNNKGNTKRKTAKEIYMDGIKGRRELKYQPGEDLYPPTLPGVEEKKTKTFLSVCVH